MLVHGDDENAIRADKWHTMSMVELCAQRDIIMDRISKLGSMPQTPTILDVRAQMTGALQYLNDKIENGDQ